MTCKTCPTKSVSKYCGTESFLYQYQPDLYGFIDGICYGSNYDGHDV